MEKEWTWLMSLKVLRNEADKLAIIMKRWLDIIFLTNLFHFKIGWIVGLCGGEYYPLALIGRPEFVLKTSNMAS